MSDLRIYPGSKDGQHFWHEIADTGDITADGSESCVSPADAKRSAIEHIRRMRGFVQVMKGDMGDSLTRVAGVPRVLADLKTEVTEIIREFVPETERASVSKRMAASFTRAHDRLMIDG